MVSSINPSAVREPGAALQTSELRTARQNLNGHLPSAWTPLLGGKLAKHATAVLEAISEDVLRAAMQRTAPNTPRCRPPLAAMDSSLASGSAGLAVFYASLAEAGLGTGADNCARAFLSHAVDLLAAEPRGFSLFNGLTGTAWAVSHLEGRVFASCEGDPNEAVDETLRRLLRRSPWRGEFGMLSGLAGFGVYALERLHCPAGVECLKLVVDRLDEIAEHNELGVTWFTNPRFLSDPQREETPSGHYNLGMAGGTPGVIAFLGQVCAQRDEKLRTARWKARDLLDRAVPWLLAQQPGNRTFSPWIGPDVEPKPARLAWCYGDLGIAVALLQAAHGTDNKAWEKEALKIAHRAARCPVEKSGVVDGGLCHGAAGVAHLFNRLFQATGDEVLKRAACLWLSRTLEMHQPGKGIAGFPKGAPDSSPKDEPRWSAELGILEGAAGVALALLAGITDIEPQWDRVMLTSIVKSPAAGWRDENTGRAGR